LEIKDKVLAIKSHYRTGKDNIGQDFFRPCLEYCISYKRAVGYFSSSALITWASSLPRFTMDDKLTIELLVSPNLTEKDKEALLVISGTEEKQRLLQEIGDQIILDVLSFAEGNQTVERRIRIFSWMVASGKLEIRFAYPNHINDAGIFHEKIGVFSFPGDNKKIAFTGSANESEMGHSKNYETVDAFRSWNKFDVDRVITKEKEFEEAWNGYAEGLIVKKLSSKVLEKVKSYGSEWEVEGGNGGSKNKQLKNKWRHQDDAVSTFLLKEKGVLNMATGTGKTRTALRICKELIELREIETIIISTSGNDLLDQWYSNVIKVSNSLLRNKFTILRNYNGYKDKEYFSLNPVWNLIIVSRQELPEVISGVGTNVGEKTLLIHDEVHGLGSPGNREKLSGLSDEIRFRLGLSATPDREYDEDGNKFILEHIGPTIFEFGLKEAIERGILCPFNYYAIEYDVTSEDREKLKRIRGRYELLKNSSNPMSQKDFSMAISDVYKTSKAKIPLFEEFISSNKSLLNRSIIFVATMEYGKEVLETVHKFSPDFHSYFSGEASEILERFANGELECMITCHRLSEGIDIHSLNNVIIFSSDRSKLELIQRIGRSLRSDPNNPNKIATIIDFIRKNDNQHKTADDERKEWLSELSKIRQRSE
jgi:superfamily II DNA or RNA helicase